MAITLGGITLSDLIIDNELGDSEVLAIVVNSLGGRPMVFEQESYGKHIDLVGTVDSGWMARSDLASVKALAAVPSSTYTLSYEGVSSTVRFRNEDQPVIESEPVLARPNQADTDWYYNITIKLMEM